MILVFTDQRRYDRAILDSNLPIPFPEPPARNQLLNNPAKFIVGREDQINRLEQMYEDVLVSGQPKLGYLQGSQGVGKSTLASWFVQKMEKDLPESILLVPIETSPTSGNFNMKKFCEITIRSFIRTRTLNWLAYKITIKLIQAIQSIVDNREFNTVLEKLQLQPHIFDKIVKHPEDFSDYIGSDFVSKLVNVFQEYFHKLNPLLPTRDFELLITIWHAVFSQSDSFKAMKALWGNGEFEGFSIDDDHSANRVFGEIVNLIKWVSPESILLIIFDHLEAAVSQAEDSYNDLFSVLIQLRQQNHIMILLSGTFDAFNSMESVVKGDMNRQIENWGLTNLVALNPLSVEECQQVIATYLQKYWSIKSLTSPSSNSLYPFSREAIEYIYQIENKDLRRTLEYLYYQIKIFREQGIVTPVLDLFQAFKTFKRANQIHLDRREIDILHRKLLDPKIQDKSRSTMVEMGIFKTLVNYAKTSNLISNVKHEPPLGRKKLKPDIYFETGSMLDGIRRIAIEVKIYRSGKSIPRKEVKKTHSLLESGEIDYLIWFSNVPLDSEKFSLKEDLKPRVGRVQELTHEELGYATLLTYQDELFSTPLTDKSKIEILLAKSGIDLKNICQTSIDRKAASEIIRPVPKLLDQFFDDELEEEEIDEDPDEPALITSQLEEIQISENAAILNEILNNNTKTYCQVNTILKNLKKEGLDLEHLYSIDEAANRVLLVAGNNNFKITAARVYFK